MNKFKTNARILLIIIVSAFVVIPITAILLSKAFGIHEGMEDYDMTGKECENGSYRYEWSKFHRCEWWRPSWCIRGIFILYSRRYKL